MWLRVRGGGRKYRHTHTPETKGLDSDCMAPAKHTQRPTTKILALTQNNDALYALMSTLLPNGPQSRLQQVTMLQASLGSTRTVLSKPSSALTHSLTRGTALSRARRKCKKFLLAGKGTRIQNPQCPPWCHLPANYCMVVPVNDPLRVHRPLNVLARLCLEPLCGRCPSTQLSCVCLCSVFNSMPEERWSWSWSCIQN